MAGSAAARRQLAFNLRANARLERGARRKIRIEINKRIRAASAAYKKDGTMGADNALRGHEDAMDRIVRDQYMKAVTVYGPRVLNGLKGDGAWEAKDFADDLFARFIADWLGDPDTDKIGRDVARTTRVQIRDVISKGIQEGFGSDKIGRLIRKELGGFSSALRAHTIARTEIHNAAAGASDIAARSAGIPELEREWLAVEDHRTRGFPDSDHDAASGQRRGMDDPFNFIRTNGSSYLLMRPGDPSGPAGGTINCRCILAYHPPEA